MLTDNAEDLDLVMLMYNLLEYSDNHSMTSGSLQNYYRHEINDVGYHASNSKSFKYKTKITGKTEARPAQGGNDASNDPTLRDPGPLFN